MRSRLAITPGYEYVELPVAFDPVTVVVNPQNSWANSMTVEELKKMWEPLAEGKITRWRQVNPAWPDEPLSSIGPERGFRHLMTTLPEPLSGKQIEPSRFLASEDDTTLLVRGVAGDKNGLGFFGFGYYKQNEDKLKAVAIDNGRGEGVLPSAETVEDGTYQPYPALSSFM